MMDGVAEPWTNNSRPRLRVWDDPLAATIPGDWVLRYVVGWPDGADASRPGAGPPHGVIVATPDSSLETGEILRVRRSVLRRGGGPGVRAGRVPNNDLAATLARAGSIGPINAHTIFIPSWQFADIPRWLALRRPRAGFPPPGTDFGLGFGGTATATGAEAQGLESRGARIGGAVTIGSIPGAEPQWTDPGNPRLPTVFAETTPFSTLNGQDCADCGTITANEIILRGDARFANASAGGGIDGERVSVDGSVTTSRLQAGTMRVDGTWTGTSLNAETMDVGGTAIISGTLAIGERAGVTGSRATFSELDSGRIGINGQLTVQDTPDEIGLFSSDETSAAALTVTGPDARCIGCVPPPLQPGDPGYVPP
ncbi:MAG: hypothetical protein OXE48_05010 [Gammaproteobacteria bacterium]|nr:hypothetical protein [Gammaproteobacteria bacterium]